MIRRSLGTEHYYSKKPEAVSRLQQIEYSIGKRELAFTTDNGVFSKGRVDRGSDLLIKTVISEGYSGKILDLGCGYGAVGISLLAFSTGIQLVMTDINERAVELCKKNVAQNICRECIVNYVKGEDSRGGKNDVNSDNCGKRDNNADCADRTNSTNSAGSVNSADRADRADRANGISSVYIAQSDGFFEIDRLLDKPMFDYILLNPPVRAGKHVVFKMYEECMAHLNAEGRLYVVIRRKQGMESSQKELSGLFGNCKIVGKKSGYFVLTATNKQFTK